MNERRLAAGLACTVIVFAANEAGAAPALRVQVEQKGDFALIGNTLAHDCGGNPPAPVVGTVGACGNNATTDTGVDVFWRSGSPTATQAQANDTITNAQARSTAILTLPAGATVTHAYVYWAAYGVAPDNTATLDRPGGFTQNLTALQTFTTNPVAYQAVANVTTLVQTNGNGAYRMSALTAPAIVDQYNESAFAAWWMVVLYQLSTDPPRNLAVFDGLDVVANGAPQNVTLSGFLVPAGFGAAKLGVVAYEGDTTITGDQFFFNGGAALSDTQNPANNFFNRTRSRLGAAVTVPGDLPQLTGGAGSMSGMDLDIVDITSKLTAGQTSAPISATSTQDQYWLGGFVTSIPIFRPEFASSAKTAVDVNGGSLLPGDVIEYTVVATNTGNDTAVGTVMNDVLPAGLTFVPASIQITAGPNTGAKTDATADDQCEYIAGTRTVRCRLGTGANGTTGGTLAPSASTTIVFRVTVDATASGTINNQAVITAGGQQGAPPADTPTDGNGSSSGSPPTPIVVDMCANDSQCTAPTPYCNVTPTPNVCVQCLLDAHCPGATPTCDSVTNTCVCVPSGVELCDGKDNDCNGTADDGNPGGGIACNTGLQGVCAAGTTLCSSGAITCVPTVQPGAQPESCDGLDNNCDGAVDEGFNVGAACTVGVGACQATGTNGCDGMGGVACSATAGTPQTETCDTVDNDCDGTVDNGFGTGVACTAGLGVCMQSGTVVCTGPTTAACNAVAGTPGQEICGDALDSDCDGNNDNGCVDTDSDGLYDSVETKFGLDPNDADTDDDGVRDGDEPSYSTDTDGDGLINALDPDSDNDGLLDGTELGKGCSDAATNAAAGHCRADADNGATKTNPLDADTDDGGVSDGAEDANLNGAVDGNETDPNLGTDDNNNADDDGDGLSSKTEAQLGTNPNDADTDDDGVIDGQEPNPSDDTDGDGIKNALDPDSDGDGLFDGTEMGKDCSNAATDTTKGNCIADADDGATKTSPVLKDTDHGGVPDGSEDANRNGQIDAGELNPNDPTDDATALDSDSDGLSDALETSLGTNPNDADTDDDGVIDGQEVNFSSDTDGDGLINARDPDSDNDGLLDGTEQGKDCSNAATNTALGHCIPDADQGATKTNPLDADTDDGGVTDGAEDTNLNGAIDANETDPNDPSDDGTNIDSDGDGLSNKTETQIGTNPNDADSDDDGVIDGAEANPADDTDGDGLINALDPDSDNDGLLDGTEMGKDCSNAATDTTKGNCVPDADNGVTTTSPVKKDTDNGGVPDGSEDVNRNGQIDAGELNPNDPSDDATVIDTDGDGLSDALETSLGTNPNDADSDDDGVLDGQEPNFASDTDGDGLINALDPDSDNDGLFDGTEMGKDCTNTATDTTKNNCVADADNTTTTSPVDADTDDGSVSDGTEDANHNGKVDAGETDPNNGADDVGTGCTTDSQCGSATSGKVCDANGACVNGCRGTGNGCPGGYVCTSTDGTIGTCVVNDAGAGGSAGKGGSGGAAGKGGSDAGPVDAGKGGSAPEAGPDARAGAGGAPAVNAGDSLEGGGCTCSTNTGSTQSAFALAIAGLAALIRRRRR